VREAREVSRQSPLPSSENLPSQRAAKFSDTVAAMARGEAGAQALLAQLEPAVGEALLDDRLSGARNAASAVSREK
jgi:hypothetical protein